MKLEFANANIEGVCRTLAMMEEGRWHERRTLPGNGKWADRLSQPWHMQHHEYVKTLLRKRHSRFQLTQDGIPIARLLRGLMREIVHPERRQGERRGVLLKVETENAD